MKENALNVIMTVLVIAQVCLSAAAWASPKWLRWAAMHLLARAESVDMQRQTHKDSKTVWAERLGL